METTVVNITKEACEVYIGRPSKWGNPFIMGKGWSREQVIDLYREYILKTPILLKDLEELKGKKLGCFCKPFPCHGDILVELLKDENRNNSTY